VKKYLIAAAFTTLVASSALSSNPAQASWAESAQGNPVHTGTNQSLWRSERAQRRSSYGWRRGSHGYPGYSAYGTYDGGVYPGYSAYGAYNSGVGGHYRY